MQTQESGTLTGVDSGARWQPQETVALIRVKSEMEAAFPDEPKPFIWDQVSRKLGELGYHRSANKCKEKFENTHKYYKRIKDGQTYRRDGQSYKFSAELIAQSLHDNNIATGGSSPNPLCVFTTTLSPAPVSVLPPMSQCQNQVQAQVPSQTAHNTVSLERRIGINFLSDSSACSEGEGDGVEMVTETVDTQAQSRKRKMGHDSDRRMIQFFDGLMKQVMQKQEAMHQKFLETIDKREQDRMIREEAWKRQVLARLERQRELIAQERVISASRDATIVGLLKTITRQSIQLPAGDNPNSLLTQPFVHQKHQQTVSYQDKDAVGNNDIQMTNVGADQGGRKQLQLSHGTRCNQSNNVDDTRSCDVNHDDDDISKEEAEENEKCDDDTKEETKPVSKIQFRRQKVGSCNGGDQAPNSAMAIVQ